MSEPRTQAGRRLLRIVGTEALPNGRRWPQAGRARLVERIVEEFIPRIEDEAEARGYALRQQLAFALACLRSGERLTPEEDGAMDAALRDEP